MLKNEFELHYCIRHNYNQNHLDQINVLVKFDENIKGREEVTLIKGKYCGYKHLQIKVSAFFPSQIFWE